MLENEDLPLLKRHFDFTHLTDGDLASGLTKSAGCDKIQVPYLHHDMLLHLDLNYSIDETCLYDSYALLSWVLYDVRGKSTEKNREKALGLACPDYLEDDALVIKICSGDIFRTNLPNIRYKQPPVAYYEKIFQSRKWKSIIFVTEKNSKKNLNPVWLYYINDNHRNKIRNFNSPQVSKMIYI
jgi:hypothetical protein